MGREWAKTTDSGWKSPTRDVEILALARSQHLLLTTRQLLDAGFSDGAIRHRIEAGRLFNVQAGVHSICPPPLSGEAQLMAAVLASGSGSAVGGMASIWLFGLRRDPPGIVDVSNAGGRGRRKDGIRVQRRVLESIDLSRRRYIPTVTATRAIFDLALMLPPKKLEELLLLASSKGQVNERRLRELACSGKPGSGAIKELLGFDIPFVRSPAETAYLQIIDPSDIESPIVNGTIEALGRRFEVDYHWPRLRLIVEVDGYAFHGGRSRANNDRDRDQILSMAGWSVHRFTRDQIVRDPREVGRRTLRIYRQALARVGENR